MKKRLLFIWCIIFILFPILFGFYKINELNYILHREIRINQVNHPEKLPNSETARISSFGFMNMMADIYWLKTIQYIGWNVIWGEYKKYLAVMMDLITDMNPYFESPYTIWQLLIPSSEKAYEEFDDPEAQKDYRAWEALWLKWVQNFCDTEKVNSIIQQEDLSKIISEEKYSNPCQSYKIPYYLAYIYYFYLKENTNASHYYKVVAAQKDAPEGARVLAAIMQGKWWDREKSLFMFLSLAENSNSRWDACTVLTKELRSAYTAISRGWYELSSDFIKTLEDTSKLYLPKLSEENEDELLADTECTNFLAKAIREINLMYIETADWEYVKDNPGQISAQTPVKLLDTGYIDFIPSDYQQYEDYGIVYKYNPDIGRFDYEMWTY